MTLTIVHCIESECHAIYIQNALRAEFDEGRFDSQELVECYEVYALGEPVKLERIEIDSTKLGIHDDAFGCVDWPQSLKELKELASGKA